MYAIWIHKMRLIILFLAQACLFPFAGFAAGKPNVLFIAVDDLRPSLGSYGHNLVQSPHIDKLAEKGTVFENAFASVPTCGASRASLLTGIRPTEHRFTGARTRIQDDTPEATTIAKHFKDNGYQTVSIGKVADYYRDVVDHWSEVPESSHKVSNYFTQVNLDILKERIPRGSYQAMPYEAAEANEIEYRDGVFATDAIKKLKSFKERDKPFFLAVGFSKPHLPFSAPKKYWDLYPEEDIVLPTNYFHPRYAPKGAIHNLFELRTYYGVPQEGPISDELALKLIHGYYACVSFVDAQVGRVLEALESEGLAENTIVVLWGDHGWQLGEHKIWNKHANFKTALHTPLVFFEPGQEGGKRTEAMTELVDIFPTLCDLAGLSKPEQLQGESLVNLISDPNDFLDTKAFSQWRNATTVFTERYAYTEWFDESGNVVENMLFDHLRDPDENVNIADRPQNQDIVNELSKILADKKAAIE